LRAVGAMHDEASHAVLLKMLTLRPKSVDVTMEGLMQGGLAILGMSLRAVGIGAADGFSEWRDPRAFAPLLAYVEDPLNNEQAKVNACAALAWVADDKALGQVVEKIRQYGGAEKADQVRRACLLEAFLQRPVPGLAPTLLTLMTPETPLEVRHQLARAIAKGGFDAAVQTRLFEMMANDAFMVDAALALVLGGSPETAARAVAFFAGKPKVALEELQALWFNSFGYWSVDDLERGVIFRVVDNALAIERVTLEGQSRTWARELLSKQFANTDFDNGPHSFTRVVLRYRLWQMAKGTDERLRGAAIRTLMLMNEEGVLFTLGREKGTAGELASRALFELRNPVPGERRDGDQQGL
jgi:hypothetical protein